MIVRIPYFGESSRSNTDGEPLAKITKSASISSDGVLIPQTFPTPSRRTSVTRVCSRKSTPSFTAALHRVWSNSTRGTTHAPLLPLSTTSVPSGPVARTLLISTCLDSSSSISPIRCSVCSATGDRPLPQTFLRG